MEERSFHILWKSQKCQRETPSELVVSPFGLTFTKPSTSPKTMIHLSREQFDKLTYRKQGKLTVNLNYLRKDVVTPITVEARSRELCAPVSQEIQSSEVRLTKSIMRFSFGDPTELKQFVQAVQLGFRSVSTKPYLIFINPFSGSGKAVALFRKRICPIFGRLGITFEEFQTAYAGQAEEWIRTCPREKLDGYRAIVNVAGDGLVNEIINGLASRQLRDAETGGASVPIGLVPAGGGNATAAAVCYRSGLSFHRKCLLHSTYILCHAEPFESQPNENVSMRNPRYDPRLSRICQKYNPLDCIVFELLPSKFRRYGVLSVLWGGLAEVDVRSERFRWLGTSRFLIAGLYSFIAYRTYHATVYYLPVEAPHATKHSEIGKSPKHTVSSTEPHEINLPTATKRRYLPAPNEPIPDAWVRVEDKFWTVVILNHSHISEDALLFADANFNDGQMRLIMVNSKCTRTYLAQFAKDMMSPHSLKPSTYVDIASVLAVRVVPNDPQASCTMLDGERVPTGAFQAEVIPEQFRIITCPVGENI